MQTLHSEEVQIRVEEDMVRVRQVARAAAAQAKLSLVDQTKLVTAASELARNTMVYGHGGVARVEIVQASETRGVRIVFEDHGPGIADVQLALKDGYTTGTGLGLGLSGAKRLCNEFDLKSELGKGTTIVITRWKG